MLFLTLFVVISGLFCHVSYRQRPRPGDVRPLGLIIPVQGIDNLENASPFGSPRQNGRRLHTGLDIMAEEGTPVVAPQQGTVVYIGSGKSAGKYIYLLDYRGEYLYEFLHLQKTARGLFKGQKVRQGQVIGFVGKTGNARHTAPHLHFAIARLMQPHQVNRERRYLDPALFLP
ncbi:MAG: M23 family metallopeptidase [Calditrichia bacterium]